LLPSDPGGIRQELVAQDLPGAKVEKIGNLPKKKHTPALFYSLGTTVQLLGASKRVQSAPFFHLWSNGFPKIAYIC